MALFTVQVTTARVAKRLALTAAADWSKEKPATTAAAAAAPRTRQLPTLSLGTAVGAAAKPQGTAAAADDEGLGRSGLADLGRLGLGGAKILQPRDSSKPAAAAAGRSRNGAKGFKAAAVARDQFGLLNDDSDDDINDMRKEAAAADQGWGGVGGSEEDEGAAAAGGGGADMMRMLQMLTTAMRGDDDIEDR